jgi:hypothetical protein
MSRDESILIAIYYFEVTKALAGCGIMIWGDFDLGAVLSISSISLAVYARFIYKKRKLLIIN